MRAVVQRVTRARVSVATDPVAEIGPGLLVLLGVHVDDGTAEADRMAAKIAGLRIFEDEAGRMNESVAQAHGAVLCVSQFTLLGDTRRGNRPSFGEAAPPEIAAPLYERLCAALGAARGRFGAHMEVELVNDGPVTVLIET